MSTEVVDIVVNESGSAKAADHIAHVGTAAEETARQTEYLQSAFETIKHTVEALGLAEVALRIIEITDSYTTLTARLGLVTTSTANLASVQKELVEISEQTRTSFEANASFFAHVADEASNLGISQKQLIETQRLLNQSFIASGATSKQAASGLEQLERAFATGTVQGRPLLTLMRDFPVTAKAIADGLNIPLHSLQEFAQKGGLSVKQLSDALIKSGALIDASFKKIPVTIGQAFDVLKEHVALYIAQADQQYQISQKVAQAILAIAHALPTLINVLKTALEVYLLFKAALLAQEGYNATVRGLNNISKALETYIATQTAAGLSTTTFGRLLVALQTPFASVIASLQGLWAVVAANPIGATILLIGAIAIALQNWGNQIVLVNNKLQGKITLLGLVLGIMRFVYRVIEDIVVAIKNWVTGQGSLNDVLDAFTAKFENIHDYTVQATKDLDGVKASTDSLSDSANNASGNLDKLAKSINGVVVGGTQMGRVNADAIPAFTNLVDAADRAKATIAAAADQMKKYSAQVDANIAKTEAMALTTRNAMGQMITSTSEWARRSGADFNKVLGEVQSVTTALDDQAAAAERASSIAAGTSSGGGGGGNTYVMQGGGGGVQSWDPGNDIWGPYGKWTGGPGSKYFGHALTADERKMVEKQGIQNRAQPEYGFADGGSFTVGGSGGVDSQLVQFMASPDETVTVENKGQQRARRNGHRDGGQTINMTVVTKDANSFRRSRQQLLFDVKAKLAHV